VSQKLDAHDKKILFELDNNSRLSAGEIGRKIRLSKETVNYRLKRIISQKWIIKFYPLINASKLGYYYYKIFLKFNKMPGTVETELIHFLRSDPSCANLRILNGRYDLAFLTMQPNPLGLREFFISFNKSFGAYILQKSIHTVLFTHHSNQKFAIEDKSIRTTLYHGEVTNVKMDKIDYFILKSISKNTRVRLVELATSLHQGLQVVRYRLRRLEHKQVINGYFSAFNFNLLNRKLVQIDLTLKQYNNIAQMITFLEQKGVCLFIYEIIGRYDLSIELYVENDFTLKIILNEFKEKFIEDYINIEVSNVSMDYVINWSPFDAAIDRVSKIEP